MRTTKFTSRIGRGLLGAVAILFGLVSLAGASTLNVDIVPNSYGPWPTYSGTAAAPDLGTTWNRYLVVDHAAGTSINNLQTSQGTPTGVGFSMSGGYAMYGSSFLVASPYHWLLDDQATLVGYYGGHQPATFAISGLRPSSPYSLWLYSNCAVPNYPSAGLYEYPMYASFTVAGAGTQAVTGPNLPGSLVLGQNYVRFSATSDSFGYITGSFIDAVGAEATLWQAAFNGLQIEGDFVPEPSTVMLLSLGGLLLWRRQRRK